MTAPRGPLAVALALIAFATAAFWPSVAALAELWSHPERRTYQHGYLIAAIALWLVWRERARLAAAAGPANPAMLVLAALGGIAWGIAWNAGLQVLHFVIWPAVLWCALAGALGLRAGRVLSLPVGFLYFAMPVWEALMPTLQSATVLANQVLGSIAGVPMLIQDTYVHIPEGTFEIAGGCSGLNYLIVGLAIATLLGELNRDTPGRRLLLILLGGAMAIASNWLRVFIIIYAGHVSDMTHYLVRVDHYNFGWVLYAFVLAAFFLIARRLPAGAAAGDEDAGQAPPPRRSRSAMPAAAAAAMALGPGLVFGPAWLARGDAEGAGLGVRALEIPGQQQWRTLPAGGDWVPVFPGADAESLVEYTNGDAYVTVYTASYLRQAQGRELVGHDSRVEGAGPGRFHGWNRRRVMNEPPLEVLEAEWRDAGGGRALLWWTYQVGGRQFARPLAAQLWYGVAALGTAPVSSIVALRTPCAGDCDRARSAMEQFASDALPQLLAAAAATGE
ncbi:MAG: exosortase [Steroidobacteraceae bacterium]|nr:exosortase [Steroidobacteraceae bacterium]